MKVGMAENSDGLEVTEVYNGITLKASDHKYALCERDGDFEIKKLPDGEWVSLKDVCPENSKLDPKGSLLLARSMAENVHRG